MANDLLSKRPPEDRSREIALGFVVMLLALGFIGLGWMLAAAPNNPATGLMSEGWQIMMTVGLLVIAGAAFCFIENKKWWWLLIPYYYACFSAVVGWLLVYGGQHRMVMGPERWSYFSGGNIVVLGNWMLLVGCVGVFLHAVVKFTSSQSQWKFMLSVMVGGEMLFLAQKALERFEAWGIMDEAFWFIFIILLGVEAFALRLCYVRYRRYN